MSYDLVDDELHERVAEGLYGAGVHGAAHVAGRVPGEHPVQQVLGTCQLVGGDLVGEGDRAVDHLAVLGHHDDDGLPGRKRHQRDLTNAAREHRGRHDNGQAVGEPREGRRGAFHERVQLRGRGAQLVNHGLVRALLLGQSRREQLVDEGAVAGVGGHAPGRGVRLLDEAGVFQSREVVAHRGGAHAQAVPLGQGTRAHGERVLDVVLDQRAQHGVGGHAPGGGVRLLNEAGVFQSREVVAHRGGAHAQAVPLGQGTRAHGERVLDVVLDQRAQHSLAPLRQHIRSSRLPASSRASGAEPSVVDAILATARREC